MRWRRSINEFETPATVISVIRPTTTAANDGHISAKLPILLEQQREGLHHLVDRTREQHFLVRLQWRYRFSGSSTEGNPCSGAVRVWGSDSSAPFPGLIRIKRLFPHQAAWATGMLQPGDILLEVNGIPLTGLTNYEALEVLRTTPNYVTLTVCHP